MIDDKKARYKKIFPDIANHFFHDDVGVTKMVGSLATFSSKKSLLVNFISEPVDGNCGALLQDVQAKREVRRFLLLGRGAHCELREADL